MRRNVKIGFLMGAAWIFVLFYYMQTEPLTK
ncbi:hypothetical protein KGM_205118A, partial [Danaus plexippus plexippus]